MYYGSRVDDGTPTYDLRAVDDGGVDQLVSVLVAVGNAGTPDDFVLADHKGHAGSANSVMIFHDRALVLVGFGTDFPVNHTRDPAEAGLSLVSPANGGIGVQLYAGVFPSGRTPMFGPFSADTVCWGTVTVAIPPP